MKIRRLDGPMLNDMNQAIPASHNEKYNAYIKKYNRKKNTPNNLP